MLLSRDLPSTRKSSLAAATFCAFLASLPVSATELLVAREFDADGLDPYRQGATRSMQVMNLIYDTLLTLDADGSIKPGLASSWQVSDDGTRIELTIRDGIKCHDGTALDAVAVKASVDRAIDPTTVNPNRPAWGPIESTSVAGNVVTIALEQPFASFLSFLASMPSEIVCPAAVAGETFQPIGTGPFKFENWVRDDRIELVANPDYHNFNPLIDNPGRPYIDRLTLRVIPDAVARLAALRAGEVDLAEPSLDDAGFLLNDSELKLYAADLTGELTFTGYTWKIPPFDNPDIRAAIAMSLNRQSYAEIAFSGLASVIDCPVAPGLFGYDAAQCATWRPAYDPERARQILADAGYGPNNPLAIRLLGPLREGWVDMYQMMQQDLAQVGIEAEIDARDTAAFLEMLAGINASGEGKPALWNFGISGVDPDYLYFVFRQPGFVNMGINDELDQLLDAQRGLMGEARADDIRQIQKYLLENSYMIPLVSPGWSWLMAHKENLEGFKMGFMVAQYYNDVTVSP